MTRKLLLVIIGVLSVMGCTPSGNDADTGSNVIWVDGVPPDKAAACEAAARADKAIKKTGLLRAATVIVCQRMAADAALPVPDQKYLGRCERPIQDLASEIDGSALQPDLAEKLKAEGVPADKVREAAGENTLNTLRPVTTLCESTNGFLEGLPSPEPSKSHK